MSEPARPAAVALPGRRRLRRVLVAAAVLLALLAAVAWWTYPSNRIARQFRALDLPSGLRQVHETSHAAPWVLDCFDDCSETTRYYTATTGERELADALVAALRARGYETDGVLRCVRGDDRGAEAHELRHCTYWVAGQGDGYNASVYVGRRPDGQVALSLAVSVSG